MESGEECEGERGEEEEGGEGVVRLRGEGGLLGGVAKAEGERMQLLGGLVVDGSSGDGLAEEAIDSVACLGSGETAAVSLAKDVAQVVVGLGGGCGGVGGGKDAVGGGAHGGCREREVRAEAHGAEETHDAERDILEGQTFSAGS